MSAWKDGEVLHTLHHERQWRLRGYIPFTPKATVADAIAIETQIAKEYPNTWMLVSSYPRLTDLALSRLALLED